MAFSLHLPKLSLFDSGSSIEAMKHITQNGFHKPLLITDQNLINSGILDGIYAELDRLQIETVTFSDITPNPTAPQVRNASKIYQDKGCDCIIAVGGGSPIDAAKATRIMVSSELDICHYEGVGKVTNAGPFFIAINTTAGTAAEMTCNSVITDIDRQVKMLIISPYQLPDIAVNDPMLMVSIPPAVTATTGMDALTHAVEGYMSSGAHTVTDHSALEAIRIIGEFLPRAYDDGSDIIARQQMACAQYIAGMSFNSAGLGLVHALAHQPGATHDLAHGVCNAILLPVICEFNAEGDPNRLRAIAEALGGRTEKLDDEQSAVLAIKLIRDLSKRVNIPEGFSSLGVKEDDIHVWIDKAMLDPCRNSNPRKSEREDIYNLYLKAM